MFDNDTIEHIDNRDDVVKTEHTRRTPSAEVTVEMWHDAESLGDLLIEFLEGPPVSPNAILDSAEDRALAVRETRIDSTKKLETLYPDVTEDMDMEIPSDDLVEELKECQDSETDYDYR